MNVDVDSKLLKVRFQNEYELNFRAYNKGVAYQFEDTGIKDRNVLSEQITITFPEGSRDPDRTDLP